MTKDRSANLDGSTLTDIPSKRQSLAKRPVLRGGQVFVDLQASESVSSITRKGVADTMILDRAHEDTVAVALDSEPNETKNAHAAASDSNNDSSAGGTLTNDQHERLLEDIFRDDEKSSPEDYTDFLTTFLD